MYALLRREVLDAAAHREARAASGRLLVCLGGGAHATGGALDALLDAAVASGADVRVTTREPAPAGASAVDPATLPEQLAWADAAVLSGGVVKYEAAVCGLPAVLLAVVDHQREVARLFAETGAAEYAGVLGEADPEDVIARARGVAGDRTMAETARSVVDGRGAQRAAAAVRDARGD